MNWDRLAGELIKIFDRAKPGGARMYMEMGGGLGDLFAQYIDRGYGQALERLRPEQKATVVIVSHNPFCGELFQNHPKKSQIEVREVGYWDPEENEMMRRVHGLPKSGGMSYTAKGLPPFHPLESDKSILDQL